MAYTDDLDLPALQPRTFNATPPGTMRPTAPDPNAPMPYGQQMSNVGGSFVDGIGAALKFIFNAPGGGGVLDPSRLAAPGAAPAAPTAPATSGGPDRTGGAQAMPLPDAVTATAKAPAVAPRRAGGSAPAAKSAAAPTGVDANGDPAPGYYFINGQPVPYGPDGLNMAGNGSSGLGAGYAYGAGGAGGGGGGMIDPREYAAEIARNQAHFARQAASEILEQAGPPGGASYRAKLEALSRVWLNGMAGVNQQGANAFNQDLTSLGVEGSRAATARFTSNNALTGDLARSAAMNHATDVGATTAADEHAVQREQIDTGTQQVGGDVQVVNGIPVVVPSFAARRNLSGSGMVTPYESRQQNSKPQVGKTYVDKQGNRAVYNADGSYTPVQ